MEEIAIRLLRNEDIPKVNDLYERAYKISRSNEKFKWEFQNGPAGPAIYVVAVDSKTSMVVGTQCAIPLYVTNASGERIRTAKSEDTLVDSNYRGKNIFEKMYVMLFDECRKSGIVAIWGFTYAIKPFVKIGFDIPFHCDFGLIAFNVPSAYSYLNGLKPKRSLVEKLKIAALVTVSRLKYMFHPGSHATVSTGVQNDLEGFRISEAGSFSLLHDSDFLNWRLRSNPYPNNHLYYSFTDNAGKQKASAICSHSSDVSYIMHMAFASDSNSKMKRGFLNSVITDLSKKTSIVRFWGFTHNETGLGEIELLKQSAFIFTGQGISFVWKKLDESGSLNVKNFVLSRLAAQGT